jgi:hypothetical protein
VTDVSIRKPVIIPGGKPRKRTEMIVLYLGAVFTGVALSTIMNKPETSVIL